MDFYPLARAMAVDLSALRRDFHLHPELSRQEFRTAERVEAELDRLGITDRRRVDGTGVYAVLRGELPGDRVVTLRCDMDALPILEAPLHQRPYASGIPGVMHACGHDAHTAALLGAARLLAERRGEWGGEVRFFFQHAEEIGCGGRVFVKEGLLEGSGRVFGVHMAPDLPVGKVSCTPGPQNASVDHFTVTVRGAASHVSRPDEGIDALYIACQIVTSLQALVTRMTSPTDPLLLGVGKLNAGTSYNIVAESAVLEGTVRALNPETRAATRERIDRLCALTARTYGGEAAVAWEDFATPLINPPLGTKEAGEVVARVLGREALVTDRGFCLTGDDFAEFLLTVEGCYAFVGTSNGEGDTCWPLHSDHFDLDEGALPIAAALHAQYAWDYLTGVFGA